jgi:hypothetical protein
MVRAHRGRPRKDEAEKGPVKTLRLSKHDGESLAFVSERIQTFNETEAVRVSIRRTRYLLELEERGGLYTKEGDSFIRIVFP